MSSRRLGLSDNTIILYTSDHGSHFCTRNSEYKRSCHEASIRVPLIATGPGFTGGGVVRELVSLIDLPATVVQAGGATVPESFDGRPLQGLVDGSARSDWPEDVYVQISESQTARAIRTARWKYGVTAAPDARVEDEVADRYAEEYLYDLEADPHERSNLVRDESHDAVRAMLRGRLSARLTAAGEPDAEILPAQAAPATA